MVILGRAAGCQLPEAIAKRLTPALQKISTSASAFLRASADALRESKKPPPLESVESDFHTYIEEFGAVRQEGLTRQMPSETAERFFALGFALEQLREHLGEVHRVVDEWARD
jgi:hypothetical protein